MSGGERCITRTCWVRLRRGRTQTGPCIRRYAIQTERTFCKEDGAAICLATAQNHVATPVIKGYAKQSRHVFGASATAAFCLARVRIRETILEFGTLEVVAQDEVNGTRHSVRAIYRRCAACDDVNALQHVNRNNVGRYLTIDVERCEPLAIDQK